MPTMIEILIYSLFISWFRYDLFEILLDVKEYIHPPDCFLVNSVCRIQYIMNRGQTRSIGWYEGYVLDREFATFKTNGGDVDYFVSGAGAPGNCSIM